MLQIILLIKIDKETYFTGNQPTSNGMTKGAYPPIISAKTIEKVKARLATVRRKKRKTSERMNIGKASNLFSDILFCEDCGASINIVVAKDADYRRYGCSQKIRGRCDNAFTLLVNDFETRVMGQLLEFIDVGEFGSLVKQIQKRHSVELEGLKTKKVDLVDEKETEERRMENLVNRLADLPGDAVEAVTGSIGAKQTRIREIAEDLENLSSRIHLTEGKAKRTAVELKGDIESLRRLVLSGGREPTIGVTLKSSAEAKPEDGKPMSVFERTTNILQINREYDSLSANVPHLRRDARIRIKALLSQLVDKIELSHDGKARIHLQTGRLEEVDLLSHCGF